jgi:hypothetical protein
MASRQRPQLSQCGLHHVACVPEDVENWESDPSRLVVPVYSMMHENAEVILIEGMIDWLRSKNLSHMTKAALMCRIFAEGLP